MNKKLSVTLGIVIVIAILIWIVAMTSRPTGTTTSSETGTSAGATVAISSVVDSTDNTAAVAGASIANKTISWTVEGYPKDAGININLLRKTSDSPASYDLVRVIAENTANDGSENWQPMESDGTDLYIEVTCSTTYQFAQGCSVTGAPFKVQ